MSETALATTDKQVYAVGPVVDDLKIGGFTPNVKLAQSTSNVVKDKLVEDGNIYIGDDSPQDCGTELDVIVLDQTPLAMTLANDQVEARSYKPADPLFQAIRKQAEARKNTRKLSNLYGREYLVYVPKYDKFAKIYLGSPTTRRLCDNMNKHLGQLVRLGTKTLDLSEGTCTAYILKECPVTYDNLPPNDVVQEEVAKFKAACVDKKPEAQEEIKTESGGR
jgi:hypothetical protein